MAQQHARIRTESQTGPVTWSQICEDVHISGRERLGLMQISESSDVRTILA